jgi:2-(1,2-epoxy-1,2-dihydrophenyl)acetyl-CoA isomerase
MSYEHVRLELSPAQVATLTIARPDRLNALSGQTVDELTAAVGEARSAGARCLLLTGEGRGFSSGADLASGGGLPKTRGKRSKSISIRSSKPCSICLFRWWQR